MKELLLTKGIKTLVDDDVYDWLSPYQWHVNSIKNSCSYARRTISNLKGGYSGSFTMHRIIAGVPRSFRVKHVDGNTLNNTRENIYVINPNGQKVQWVFSENPGKSDFQGVYWDVDRGVWNAKIKPLLIGQYDNEVEAAQEYNRISWNFFKDPRRMNNLERLGL